MYLIRLLSLEQGPFDDGNDFHIKDSSTIGYFLDLDSAADALKTLSKETYSTEEFGFAVAEFVGNGLYSDKVDPTFFKLNNSDKSYSILQN